MVMMEVVAALGQIDAPLTGKHVCLARALAALSCIVCRGEAGCVLHCKDISGTGIHTESSLSPNSLLPEPARGSDST